MFHRMLIISANEGFIIKGLETKLQGIGVDYRYSAFKMNEIAESFDNTDLVILFTDDGIGNHANVLTNLKERCVDSDKEILVIGTKEEYEVLTRFVSESCIYKLFERPLDMDELISDLEKYQKEDEKSTERKSILIVDDDVSYMGIIMEWLKDKYKVSLANSGMKAITWLAKNHADLILLDYEMPITPGPQVLEMIRSEASTEKIPVMFLTGKSDKESIMKVLALKPVGYQLKTVGRNQLRENIAKFFASQK